MSTTDKFAIARLEAAIDCILAAERFATDEGAVAERFAHRAYRLMEAALCSLKGEEDPFAKDPVY